MDVHKVIQSILSADHYAQTVRRNAPGYRPLVTVARDLGAGGGEIAERLSQRLGVPVYDNELLDAVAERARVDSQLLARIDEHVRDRKDEWIRGLLMGQDVSLSVYRHHLVDVMLCIAPQGGIVLGRGGHVILANREAFRLRITGSETACARRVAAREGIPLDAAQARVREVNEERDQSLYSLFRRRLHQAETFDLVLNTDKFDDHFDAAAEVVVQAMERFGFNTHESVSHG